MYARKLTLRRSSSLSIASNRGRAASPNSPGGLCDMSCISSLKDANCFWEMVNPETETGSQSQQAAQSGGHAQGDTQVKHQRTRSSSIRASFSAIMRSFSSNFRRRLANSPELVSSTRMACECKSSRIISVCTSRLCMSAELPLARSAACMASDNS